MEGEVADVAANWQKRLGRGPLGYLRDYLGLFKVISGQMRFYVWLFYVYIYIYIFIYIYKYIYIYIIYLRIKKSSTMLIQEPVKYP